MPDGLRAISHAATRQFGLKLNPDRLSEEEVDDLDDTYSLDEIALYLPRQGRLITWSLESFMRKLGGSESLAEARAVFRAIL